MLGVSDAIDWDSTPDGLDRISADLRAMRHAAGAPSFNEIARRIGALRERRGLPEHERHVARTTVWASFQEGRRRMDADAVVEIAAALGLPDSHLPTWSQRVRAARAAADGASVVVARHQAPLPVPSFAGRDRELATATSGLSEGGRVWISGMAGAGKTQLALAAVQRLGSTGGSVFLDLRGRNAEAPRVDPEAAQRAILRQLKVDDSTTTTPAERARLILNALASRRAALMLDDAAGPEHVEAIIGASGDGRVVVTSRSPQGDGDWLRVHLQGLDRDETTALLRGFSPGLEIAAEDADRLAEISGGLPLAIALVGARLASHPEWTLGEHVDLMVERLRSARVDDEVRAALELSYAELPADAALLLRVFADLPLAEMDAESAAAATETDARTGAAQIDALADASLAIRRDDGRVALHALVRAFGQDRARDTDPPRVRSAAFERVTLQATQKVWSAYATIARSMSDSPRTSDFVYPERDWSAEEADAWLHRALPALLALAHAAPERGHPELLFHLSDGLSWWMNLAGRPAEALRLHQAAADVAAEVGDARALATSSLDAGQLLLFGDDPSSAQENFDRARELVDEHAKNPDLRMAGLLTNMSALVDLRLGRVSAAIDKLRQTVQLHERNGDAVPLILSASVNLSVALHRSGRFDEEAEVIAKALDLAIAIGHRLFEANLHVNHAGLLLELGRPAEALASAETGIALSREIGHPHLVVHGAVTSAAALAEQGDPATALRRVEEAVATAREIGQAMVTADALVHAVPIAMAAEDRERAQEMLQECEALLGDGVDHVIRGRLLRLRAEWAEDEDDRHRLLESAAMELDRAGSYLADEVREQIVSR